MQPTSPIIDCAGATSVGLERRNNEDQFLIGDISRSLRVRGSSIASSAPTPGTPIANEGTLLIVADGMGGMSHGELASEIAVRTVADHLTRVLPWRDEGMRPLPAPRGTQDSLLGVRRDMTAAMHIGDAAVQRASDSPMGTTLTAAYVRFPRLYLAHVGDSRCYLLRDTELRRMTRDHTVAEQLREIEPWHEIDPSSPWNHVLWNALGGGPNAKTQPEVHRVQLRVGDLLLLCSDGLTKHVDDDAIRTILLSTASADDACDSLLEAAHRGGGSDNITVVVARIDSRTNAAAYEPLPARQTAAMISQGIAPRSWRPRRGSAG